MIALLLGVPLIGSLVSPVFVKKKADSEWVEIGETRNFPVDRPTMVTWSMLGKDGWVVENVQRACWVYTPDGESFTVWNPRCTHLGCAVYYDEQKHTLNSPCHGGVFAMPDGRVTAGPPPRPLDTLPVKVEGGKLFTVYKDFKLGIPAKIEI